MEDSQTTNIEEAYKKFLNDVGFKDTLQLRSAFVTGCSVVFFGLDNILSDKEVSRETKEAAISDISDQLLRQHNHICTTLERRMRKRKGNLK